MKYLQKTWIRAVMILMPLMMINCIILLDYLKIIPFIQFTVIYSISAILFLVNCILLGISDSRSEHERICKRDIKESMDKMK